MSDLNDYSGAHWLVEFHGASRLDDAQLVADVLRSAAVAGGARVLRVDTHHFGDKQGVAGVALLAESHISIHTWPERAYAAIDVFFCGHATDPAAAVDVLRRAFKPQEEATQTVKRGYSIKD